MKDGTWFQYGKWKRFDLVYDLLMLRPYQSKVKNLSDFIGIVYNYFERCPRCGRKLNKNKKEIQFKSKERQKPRKVGKRILLLREW